jgi:hypothetical protein
MDTPNEYIFYKSCLFFRIKDVDTAYLKENHPVVHKKGINIYLEDDDDLSVVFCIGIIKNNVEVFFSPLDRIDMTHPDWNYHPYKYSCCEEITKINTSINGSMLLTATDADGFSSENRSIDRDFSTGWMMKNSRRNKIELSFDWSLFCHYLIFVNGYDNGGYQRQRYARIKTMELYFNNESIGIVQLENTDKLQKIFIFNEDDSKRGVLTLKILDTYSEDEDTLIIINEIILFEGELHM